MVRRRAAACRRRTSAGARAAPCSVHACRRRAAARSVPSMRTVNSVLAEAAVAPGARRPASRPSRPAAASPAAAGRSAACSGRSPSISSPARGAAAGSGSVCPPTVKREPSAWPVQQVHRRRADEAGDEGGGRAVVDLFGRADLLHAAGVHHDHALRQRHRLDLVVGDEQRGDAEFAVQLLDLQPRLRAQLGVEVGQRLVEQEHLRLAHDGAAHGHALALAARELARLALEQAARARRISAALSTRALISAIGTLAIFRP